MFSEIISRRNLEAAYLALAGKFAQDSKELRYHGLDNIRLPDHDLDSRELLDEIRQELIDRKPIDPALRLDIPKKSNPAKSREIFIYTVKERIKAEAICRVVLPLFEKSFSDRLFSYRPHKPPYRASYLFARRYRRCFASDRTLVADLHDYSGFIDKNILLRQLEALIPDPAVLELLKLFIFNRIYENGTVRMRERGIVQGVPLIALFANLYLSDLDFKYEQRAAFYIRVGDDLAMLDPDPEKLARIAIELRRDVESRGLALNADKMFEGPASQDFSFLGYCFAGGVISLEESFVRKIELGWKSILAYKNESSGKKARIIKSIMRRPDRNFNNQFQEIVKDKAQANNSVQWRELSESFFRILTEFWYGRYSERNRRLLPEAVADFGIFPLYGYYKNFHYERNCGR